MDTCTPALSLPSKQGKRTLLEAFDEIAWDDPERTFACESISPFGVEDGFRDVSYNELSRAVDAFAQWIRWKYGLSEEFETIMFMAGPCDLRYAIVFLGLQKVGYKAMFVSPSNAVDHNVELLRSVDCTKCLYTADVMAPISALCKRMPNLQATEMPRWQTYANAFKARYPFYKPLAESRWDPVLVLHSSGSTGVPTPVILRNGSFAAIDAPIPEILGREIGGMECMKRLTGSKKIYTPTPMYHLSGFLNLSQFPILGGSVSVLTPCAMTRPAPAIMQAILETQDVKLFYSPPVHIEAMAKSEAGMRTLENVDYLCYSGAPLATSIGERLKDRTRLILLYGSTEAGGPTLLIPEQADDWEYLEFHPLAKPKFVGPVVDGAYELIWRANVAGQWMGKYTIPADILGLPSEQQISEAEDPTREMRSKDLFLPHPDPAKAGRLWKFYGRTDDVIILSNGAKLNPVPFELAIMAHRRVNAALMVGEGRDRLALLIEPSEHLTDPAAFLEGVWPLVLKANEEMPERGQVRRRMMAIVAPGEFVRAPKGTVVRRLTGEKFAQVVQRLYGI